MQPMVHAFVDKYNQVRCEALDRWHGKSQLADVVVAETPAFSVSVVYEITVDDERDAGAPTSPQSIASILQDPAQLAGEIDGVAASLS